MRQFAVTIILALGLATTTNAQSFLDDLKKEKAGQGTVTVNQSQDIDELVNNTKLVRTQPSTAKPVNDGNSAKHGHATGKQQADKASTPTSAEKTHADINRETNKTEETDTPAVDTSKKVIRNGRKITGYRVQAYSGGNSRADRQKAENIGNSIKTRFPDLPVYVHFYSPRWICRVGNFRTYDEANEVLKEIKSMGYGQACIVKGKITVGY